MTPIEILGMATAAGMLLLLITASWKLISQHHQRHLAADAEGPATDEEIEAILEKETDDAAVCAMLATTVCVIV